MDHILSSLDLNRELKPNSFSAAVAQLPNKAAAFLTIIINMEGSHNSTSSLRVGSFNCNGLGNYIKRDRVLNWLKAKHEDIILLQETHTTSDSEEDWRRSWEGEILFNHGNSNSTGVTFLFKRNPSIKICSHKIIVQGRTSLVEIEIDSTKYCLTNVYCPNSNDTSVVENTFAEALGRPREDFLIFAGDWNTVLNNNLDKEGGNPTHSNTHRQTFLNQMITDHGLSDIFRLNYGDARVYTHINKQHKTRTRLDFFLIDDTLVNFPTCCTETSHGFNSDHSYISLHIQGSSIERGKGYWKFNNSHLAQDNFKSGIREIIRETESQSFDSYSGLWDVIKMKIKDFAIRYGKKVKKDKNHQKFKLTEEIEMLKSKDDFLSNDTWRKNLFDAEGKLNEIINQETQGAITRAKIDWTEQGERSTKYFFGLEKSLAKKKSINKLIDCQGNTLNNQRNISNHVVEFYQHLYTNSPDNEDGMDSYISSSHLSELEETLSASLDNRITMLEFESVVKNLKNNKSPGWDGLTAEFYKTFWEDIRSTLFLAFQESVEGGTLTPSQRIGILTLLPKPKSPIELNYLKNWRPITLLNVDYKMFAHVIKNRIIKALPTVITKVQSGFQAGRSTCDNLILMCLTLEHFHENTEEEGLLMQVDLEKAFDSVEHNFLFKVIKKLGFGEYLTGLIRTAFNGCFSYANINGHLSSPIFLLKGLHQGSPLSPVLFLLISQVLTNKLERNTEIKGLKISGIDILISLFADDTDLFLKPTTQCVRAVIDELMSFGRYSGCKPNINKTKCIPLGATKRDVDFLRELTDNHGENFTDNTFTALGITFNNFSSPRDICHQNYNSKLEKATTMVKTWSKRNLTLIGKCQIIKSILFAQFTYLIVPLLRPKNNIIKSIEKIVYNFLWGGKSDKVRREVIARSRDHGGLDLFRIEDFITGLKVALISKLASDTFSHLWKDIISNQLKYPNQPIISIENSLLKRQSTSGFAHDLLSCYSDWKIRSAAAGNGTVNHCVWGNRVISGLASLRWNTNLLDKNIYYISHFVTEEGEIMTYNQFLNKWEIRSSELSSTEYASIRLALRRFNCPNTYTKNVKYIELDSCLSFLNKHTKLRSKVLRDKISSVEDPKSLAPMRKWGMELDHSVDWISVFSNLFFSLTNHFKLIQFHYKLWHRISTCRYMRHKMRIDLDSPRCSLCNGDIETLEHIFLNCYHTQEFVKKNCAIYRPLS